MKTSISSLTLTAEYFELILNKVHEIFLNKHQLTKTPKTFQLYGYGTFNDKKPSLKNDFEEIGSEFINGKYLYDKSRELEKGKIFIKVNNYYKTILLLYLGYEDIKSFLEDHIISETAHSKQLALINEYNKDVTYYFLNYYFGEDNLILKGQTIVSNNWKKVHHIYLYPQADGTLREHHSQGSIKRDGDTLSLKTKALSDGKSLDGGSEIYYIGHRALSNTNFLVGTYCSFDIYNNTVAGRSILEKCDSKEEMETQSKSPNIPSYIAQEVRNKRIINPRVVPNSYLELSHNSPYASLYGKLPGTYTITFDFGDGFQEVLKFIMLATNFKIETLTENVYIEKDRIELINKGSIINFRFGFSGMIALERVNIYFKSYYLKGNNTAQKGVFSGIDNENRLVNGTVSFNFIPS